jgi:hypothetical protein
MDVSIFNKAQSSSERMTLTEQDAFTLPQKVRFIRVISGTAWVSVGREDVIVRPAETLYLNRPGVVITALGKRRLEFDMIA